MPLLQKHFFCLFFPKKPPTREQIRKENENCRTNVFSEIKSLNHEYLTQSLSLVTICPRGFNKNL